MTWNLCTSILDTCAGNRDWFVNNVLVFRAVVEGLMNCLFVCRWCRSAGWMLDDADRGGSASKVPLLECVRK